MSYALTPRVHFGRDFLRSHRVLYAVGQHRLYLSYSGGPIFAADTPPAPDPAAPVAPAAATTGGSAS